MGELQNGVVKWFNDAKGFGFIEHPSGRDVFVHYSVIESEGFKTLKDGEEVQYELSEGDKGLHAKKVLRVNAPAKRTAQAASSMVAPNLETGSVSTSHKTSSSLIEVEKEEDAQAGIPLETDVYEDSLEAEKDLHQ